MLYEYYRKESDIGSVRLCHRHVKNICKYGQYCRYTHINKKDLLMITDDNPNVNPCAFLTEDNGCAMCVPSRVEGEGFKIQLHSCELHRGYNHFYKPKYVCEHYFYQTSKEKVHLCQAKNCPYLHIPWNNFKRNMFCSKRDPDKKLCMEFLTQIAFNLVHRGMRGEQEEFDKIMEKHNLFMEHYKSRYIPKCIKCYLSPNQPKLVKPKLFTTYVLHKKNMFKDIIIEVNKYMYDKHTIKKDGTYDCLFIKRIERYPFIKAIELYTLSNLFIHGPRITSFVPSRRIGISKRDEFITVDSTNGPEIDYYPLVARNAIYKNLLED